MHLYKLLIYALFFNSNWLFAQSYLSFKGEVVDSLTTESLPYVSVQIAGKPIGSVTNEEGYFELSMPFLQAEQDTLMVVYLGYKTYKMPLKAITSGNIWQIRLQKIDEKLQDVTLSSRYTVFDLIQDALNKVNENYYEDKTVYLHNFLKLQCSNENQEKIVKEMEAHLIVSRPKINGYELARVFIEKARKKTDIKHELPYIWYYKYLLDFVEKDMLFFGLERKNFKRYDYKMTGIEFVKGKPNYRIFIRGKGNENLNAEVFIDTTSLAFSRFTVEQYISNQKDIVATPLYKILFKTLYIKYEINYQKIGAKWYLQNVKHYDKVRAKDTKQTYHLYTEYDLKNIENEKISLPSMDRCMHERSVIDFYAMLWDNPAWNETPLKTKYKKAKKLPKK